MADVGRDLMSMEEDFLVLLRERVRSRRQRADLDAQKAAQALQDDAVTRGRLGAGFYAAEQDERCAADMTARGDALLDLTEDMLRSYGIRLDERKEQELFEALHAELQQHYQQLGALLRRYTEPHGHRYAGAHLLDAFERARDHVRQELKVLRIRDERRSSIALDAALSAPRYQSAREHWAQATQCIESEPPDLRRAVAVAVQALEAVARILVPGSKTLGEALKSLRHDGRLAAQLSKSLEGLWGFTSGSAGVRHGAPEPYSVSEGEARYVVNAARDGILLLLSLDRSG